MSELVLFGGALACAVLFVMLIRLRVLGFPAQKPDDYMHLYPVLDVREHLKGNMICEGCIFGPFGRVTTTFVAYFVAKWDGNVGVIQEAFEYSDGSTQIRQWRLTVNEDGSLLAEADDVPGIGKGMHSGFSLLLKYPIRLPETSGGYTLRALDGLYLTPNGTLVNRSQFRKFGVMFAELVATIRKDETR